MITTRPVPALLPAHHRRVARLRITLKDFADPLACTGRLAITVGLAMALAAGLAPAAQASHAATTRAASRISAAATPVQPQAVKLLYNQNNDAGGFHVPSDNFGSGNSFNAQGADDFAVPQGRPGRSPGYT